MAKDDPPTRPMTLGNMRRNGVHGPFVTCQKGRLRCLLAGKAQPKAE
jgi:hypothetical protein